LGTRLLVFDKVRRDAQAQSAYGATITYDLPLKSVDRNVAKEVAEQTRRTEAFIQSTRVVASH
jgi:NitT/TauT family transport system ATP-binding protein